MYALTFPLLSKHMSNVEQRIVWVTLIVRCFSCYLTNFRVPCKCSFENIWLAIPFFLIGLQALTDTYGILQALTDTNGILQALTDTYGILQALTDTNGI